MGAELRAVDALAAGALAPGAGSGRVSTADDGALCEGAATIAPTGARSTPREAIFEEPEKGSENGSLPNREASEHPATRAATPAAAMSRTAVRE
ncbi:MAG: hypothetical protein AB7F41_06635 [Methylocystis sp.]|uniref:hypothetical protein n=1 Tax=Methylocystis sp. TaxID=1911079 RepID=UPI003D132FA1